MSDKKKALSFFDNFDAQQLNEPEETVAEVRKPKKPAAALLAKGLAAFDKYAKDPNNIIAQALPFSDKTDRAGLTGELSSLLGIPEAASFFDRVAYGDNLTVGKNQTLKPAENVVEGALTAAPFLGQGLASGYKAASKLPTPKPNQVNGLLGFLGKNDPAPGLFLSHGADSADLVSIDTGKLIRELYAPSFAVTKDKLSTFKGADSLVVPWPENVDPKTAKSILTATDSYTPRWHAYKGKRFDNLPDNLDLQSGLASSDVSEFVNQRLYEKLGNPFPHGGIKQEGAKAFWNALPGLNAGMASRSWERTRPMSNSSDFFSQRIAESPHFQSLEHFVKSPYGGQLVGDTAGHGRLSDINRSFNELAAPLVYLGEPITKTGAPPVELLKGLASNTHPWSLRVVGKTPREDMLGELRVIDQATGEKRPLTPEEFKYAQGEARRLLRDLKTAPTDYAELKLHGPWQVNQGTTAGIISRADNNALARAARDRGLPYERVYTDADSTEAANSMLARRGKTTVSLHSGLTGLGDISRVPSQTSASAGDYAAQVEKVKSSFKALENNKDDLESFKAFQKAANDFKMDSDLFVQAGKIKNSEAQAMSKWLNAKLETYKPVGMSATKAPFEVSDSWKHFNNLSESELKAFNLHTLFKDFDSKSVLKAYDAALAKIASSPHKDFFTTAGLDSPTGATTAAAKSLIDGTSLALHKSGSLDYIPDVEWNLMEKYAKGGGFSQLDEALQKYKHASMTGTDADHDAALVKLLTAWDATKPTKTSVAVKTGMPTKDWSKATWEELNAVTGPQAEAMPAVEWQQWDNAWAAAAEKNKTSPSLSVGMATGASPPKGQISSAGLENLLSFAKGEKPWNQSTTDWFTSNQFTDEFPALTEKQAQALNDISFNSYMQKKHGGNWEAKNADIIKEFFGK